MINLGSVSTQMVTSFLEESGFTISEAASLAIVLVDDYLEPKLKEFNQTAYTNKNPWLLVKLHGTQPLIGPLFTPTKTNTPCWECLAQRLQLHDKHAKWDQVSGKTQLINKNSINHPIAIQFALSRIAMELVNWLYHGKHQSLEQGLISLTIQDGGSTYHQVVKRPQCATCGDENLMLNHPKSIKLEKDSAIINHSGGYRTIAAETTLAQYQHHVSPITGIVPYLVKGPDFDHDIVHNYLSGRNLALRSQSMFWLNMHLRSANGGKGKSDIQAKVGALCESIERYSMMYHGKEYSVEGSMQSLPNTIHPNRCMNFSEAQYENRETINGSNPKFYSMVPRPFAENEVVDWTPVYSLTNQEFKYLPSFFCYAQYPASDEKNLWSYPDSNGCAAGNTLEEAILQGILELVERDAVAIWWYNRLNASNC